MKSCPLCAHPEQYDYYRDKAAVYFQCTRCRLVYMLPEFRLGAADAKLRYEQHQNNPEDPDYRLFLNRALQPLKSKLKRGARGLDYGSGPGPTSSVMMEEDGFLTKNYDIYFAPDKEAVNAKYDFISCTETAEHFEEPGKDFHAFDRLLMPGGWLVIMTQMLVRDEVFSSWYYRKDPTHIAFYQEETFNWIGKHYAWHMEYPGPNVVLFQKKDRG